MTEGSPRARGGRNDGVKVNEEKGTERKSAREEGRTRRACEKEATKPRDGGTAVGGGDGGGGEAKRRLE